MTDHSPEALRALRERLLNTPLTAPDARQAAWDVGEALLALADRTSAVDERGRLEQGYVRISLALGGTDEWTDLDTMIEQTVLCAENAAANYQNASTLLDEAAASLADRASATFWVIERHNDIYKKPEYWTPCPSSNWVFSITSACQFVRRSDAEHINHYLLKGTTGGRVVEHGMIGGDRTSAVAGEEREEFYAIQNAIMDETTKLLRPNRAPLADDGARSIAKAVLAAIAPFREAAISRARAEVACFADDIAKRAYWGTRGGNARGEAAQEIAAHARALSSPPAARTEPEVDARLNVTVKAGVDRPVALSRQAPGDGSDQTSGNAREAPRKLDKAGASTPTPSDVDAAVAGERIDDLQNALHATTEALRKLDAKSADAIRERWPQLYWSEKDLTEAAKEAEDLHRNIRWDDTPIARAPHQSGEG